MNFCYALLTKVLALFLKRVRLKSLINTLICLNVNKCFRAQKKHFNVLVLLSKQTRIETVMNRLNCMEWSENCNDYAIKFFF